MAPCWTSADATAAHPPPSAARERDHCRCRFPGCESRRVDLHHRLVHDRGYLIAARPDGDFAFTSPGGVPLPTCPGLPAPSGTIADYHDAGITPETIIPAWYGERLNLDYAIATCFANAEYHERARQREHQAQAA